MDARIEQELALLHQRYPDLVYVPDGRWGLIPSYPMPTGWNQSSADVAFLIPVGYPGTPPYGIYAPDGMLFNGQPPENYAYADPQPPFAGTWWRFSWQPNGTWLPAADITAGSNLLNWAVGFAERFREGI